MAEGLGHGPLQHGLLSGWGVGPAGATRIAGAGAVWLCGRLLRRARAPENGPMQGPRHAARAAERVVACAARGGRQGLRGGLLRARATEVHGRRLVVFVSF
jgi:hypothetical protein